MAKWHYDLTGAEMIVRDVQVYDATDINTGEFLMQHATAANKQTFITGYVDSSACMVNGLGISLERITTAGTQGGTLQTYDPIDTAASIATTVATGARYGKAIINPFAVYLTEYSQAAADDEAVVGAGAAASTTVTITSLEDDIDGGWLYFTHLSGVQANKGQLRYLAASAAGSATTLTAATCTTAETYIKILPSNHELVDLDSSARYITTDAAASPVISLKVVQNYINPNGGAMEVLRPKLHDSSVQWDSNTKFYADLVLLNSAYNTID